MFKTCLSLAFVSVLASAAHAELPQPVIQRDAKGLVTITCATPDAVICYSLDGTEPGPASSVYLAPIVLPHQGTIKAKAFDKSALAEVTFEAQDGAPTPPSTIVPVTQNRSWTGYDWGKRHETRCALVRERKPALLLVGDSITHGLGDGTNEKDEVWRSYFESRNTVNLGFGWDRTENVLWRLRHGELDGAEPKVAVVMIGTNNRDINTPAEIATGVRAICTEIHQRTPKTKILLLGVFPRGEKPDDKRPKTEELNTLISAFDGKDGITFLDISSKFLNADGTISKEVMADFLHPTTKGQWIWAEAMEPTLKKLLAE